MMTNDYLAIWVGAGVTLLAVVQGLAALWLKTRLQSSIRHEYDRRLEQLRSDDRRRERAAIIAELFAEWTAEQPDIKRLNQLPWETSLWLPDDLAKNVLKRLANAPDAENIRTIILEVRKHLSGGSTSLTSDEIVYFSKRASHAV